jgi:hypothetical protein
MSGKADKDNPDLWRVRQSPNPKPLKQSIREAQQTSVRQRDHVPITLPEFPWDKPKSTETRNQTNAKTT